MSKLEEAGGGRNTNFEHQESHLFTPQEASKLLPDIKPKVKELVERRKVAVKLNSEIQRYDLFGFRPAEVAEKAAELDAVAEDMDRRLNELEDLGVKVKDLEFGLVDFPAEKYGEAVMLCWRYGESEVLFWHKQDEGYSKRKPLKMQLIQP